MSIQKNKYFNWLDNHIDYKIVEKEILSKALIESHVYNIFHSINLESDIEKIPQNESREILNHIYLFEVILNKKSEVYFQEGLAEDILFVLLYEDPNHPDEDYLASNSSRLFLELVSEVGVSEFDKLNNTDKYLSYISLKDEFNKRYKSK